MPYKEAYVKGYVENVHHNTAVIRATAWLADNGRKVLLIARRKEHFLTLKKMLEDQGIEFTAAWGETATSDRERAKNDFIKSNGSVLLATTIFDEGTDIPGIDAIVLAEGVKVNTNSLQRLGRGMRKKDGWNEVWVIDIVPTCHKTLMEHSLARCETYEDEGHEVTILTDWPPMDAEYDSSLLPFADLTR
jgi:superfamily II DNA or RNA helicase